jgi:hypothetical protein
MIELATVKRPYFASMIGIAAVPFTTQLSKQLLSQESVIGQMQRTGVMSIVSQGSRQNQIMKQIQNQRYMRDVLSTPKAEYIQGKYSDVMRGIKAEPKSGMDIIGIQDTAIVQTQITEQIHTQITPPTSPVPVVTPIPPQIVPPYEPVPVVPGGALLPGGGGGSPGFMSSRSWTQTHPVGADLMAKFRGKKAFAPAFKPMKFKMPKRM